jgi:phosphate transport system substrate-binding protein
MPGDDSWPIVSATFIELPKDAKDATRSTNVIKFFDWGYKNGDSVASQLEYIPLPDAVKSSVRDAWHSEVKGPDGRPIF